MPEIFEEIAELSSWIADALQYSSYSADFTPQSLAEIDRFFDDHSQDGEPRPGGLLEEQLGMKIFSLGAYVGETIRRQVGGEWRPDENNPSAKGNTSLHLPDGAVIWPIQRVMKRYKMGSEEGIATYGKALGLR
ncbi:hypothetical protein AB0B50_40800 [Streptomyces sp. NPDC041068]|uniref:hypothetical protein n=1 Tax=Streptomyces sp. NPDC041068 TaxID=3155130 RepID=UPI0033E46102